MSSGLDKMREQLKKKYSSKLRELTQGKRTFWTAPEGVSIIRVCPGISEDALFYAEVPTHYKLGPDKNLSTTCAGNRCPVCKRVTKLMNSSSEKKQKRGEQMSPQIRIAFQIIDLAAPKKVLIWTTTPSNLQEMLQLTMDPDYMDFLHPKKGYNLRVTRTGKNLATRWKIRPEKNSSKLRKWKILKKQLVNLDVRFKPLSNDKIKAVMRGENPYKRDDE